MSGVAALAARLPHITDDRIAEFRRQAFLAALSGIMGSPLTWDMDGRTITQIDDRVELAWRTADYALLRSGLI